MTTAKRQNGKPFTPIKGEIYENAGGGRYICESDPEMEDGRAVAWMTNIQSGWSCKAWYFVRYDDRTIEWDYSTSGHFVPINEERQGRILEAMEREIARTVARRGLRHRQIALTNAMLCCMI